MEVADELPDILKSRGKKGRKTLEKNWRRWMKLTPCVVATFFRLPAELHCKRHDGNGFVDDYALHFVDLLIVDEAGQVLPEVAAPSFALSRDNRPALIRLPMSTAAGIDQIGSIC